MADSTGEMTRTRRADEASIAEAAGILAAGGIVAVPTETVYGLAADAANPSAVTAIYAAKGRPGHNPLIVHVADTAMARRLARFDPLAARLAQAFWPGPLTLVLPLAEGAALAPAVTAGLSTVAIRVPAHPVMQALVRRLGRGIAAPSANASGRLSPTRADHVALSLGGRIPLILDSGPTRAGLESSIVRTLPTPTLLRQGAIPAEALEQALGQPLALASAGASVAAPGMLLGHYAPRLPIRLGAATAAATDFHLGFGAIAGDLNLSPAGDLGEAAANLFAFLHRADASGKQAIAVAPVPETGLGAAINDRLRRAAAT